MSKKKKEAFAIKEAKKPVLAVRKPPPSMNQDFNNLLDTFRNEFGSHLWDPFRGFE
jgi:hypothetical protein